jgi:hypothetical protein
VQLRLQGVKFDEYFLYDPSIELLDLFTDVPEMGWIAAVVVGGIAVLAVASLAIPQVRSKITPFFKRGHSNPNPDSFHQPLTAAQADKPQQAWAPSTRPSLNP